MIFSGLAIKCIWTETCDDETPHLITHVETTTATTYDGAVTETIQTALAAKGLLPEEHIVDSGYLDAELIVSSQKTHGLTLLGPVPLDTSWQAQAATGFDATQFLVDWQQQKVSCPAGKTSRCWTPTHDRHGKDVVHIKFDPKDCRICPCRPLCTQAKTGGRMLTLRPHSHSHFALQQARERQQTKDFKERYAKRAGIEGTISQGVHSFDLRRSRYIGLAKTRLQHIFIATALNAVRIGAWLMERPRAQTRTSRFGRLACSDDKDVAA